MRTVLLFCNILFFVLPHFALSQNRAPLFVLNNRVGVQVNAPLDVAVDTVGNIYFASGTGTVKKFRYHEDFGTEYVEYAPEGLNQENYGTYDITLDQHNNLFVVSYTYSKVAKFNEEGRLLFEFGSDGENPGQFRFPEGIAINSKDEIYVADTGNRRIQKFDNNGDLLQVIPLEATTGNYFEAPLSIDFDGEDNLYLLHNPENKVVKYSPEGEKLLEFGNKPSDRVRLQNPWKLAVDKINGHVYVTNLNQSGYNAYSLEGDLERSMSHSTGVARLYGNMMSIAVLPGDGDIIIADHRENHESQIIMYNGMGGEGLYMWGNLWQNVDLTTDEEGNVYLLDVTGKITRFNAWGELVMTYGERGSWSINSPNIVFDAPKAITSDLFNNLYVLTSPGSPADTTAIFKIDQQGHIVSVFGDLGPNTETHEYTDVAVDATGNLYVTDLTGGVIHKISSQGQYVGTIGTPGYEPGQIWMPLAVAVDRTGIVHVLDYNGGRVQQFNARGEFIRQFGRFSRNDGAVASNSDLALDGSGNVYVASNLSQSHYWIFNSRGDLLHEEPGRQINHISIDQLGTNMVIDDDQADGYSHYIADAYANPQSTISGVVYNDTNNNCVFDAGERTLSGIVVMSTPGPYYAITGEDGRYTMTVAPAAYTLHTMLPEQPGRTITATCPLPVQGNPVVITDPGQTVQHVNFGNDVVAPPYLLVSVSSTRRRRCFESTTIVRYSNTGFAPAEHAKVYLQLPPEVELLSADKPYTRLANGTYEFAIGTIGANKTGTITIQDIVTCGDESVRNRTVCTRAWITPSNNAPTKPTPTITITGQCNYDLGMVRFVVKNTGQADMTDPELFRKYIDGDLSSIEQYRLAAGDSMVLWVPTSGMTARLEADQPEGNGDNTLASVTVEACRTSATQTGFSTGIVNLMPADEEEAEVSEECLLITDSFDPNDKLVTPVGRTEENYTPTNTALKYKIRFQNTGTDVAYRVVVVDTLSEHLDLSTLQLGTVSHTHRLEVSGKGRPVLTWTFDNIMLPDSTADEPNSHGYIQFSIKPKADLPEKTAVENFADIFFDYNSPVRTNVTVNRIYDMPPVIKESVRMDLEDILATPGITGFAPAAGRYGTEVVVSGKKFSGIAARNKVYFNNVPAQVVSATASELRVRVPEGSATGTIKVVTPDGATSTTERFQVYQPPVITSFSPAEGMVGQTVTLQGNHLDKDLIESIKLGNLACEIVSHTAGTLIVKVPEGAVSGRFELLTKGGEALSAADYVVWYQPAIHSLSKQKDIVGATISISGQNFATDPARNKVHFGKVQAQVLQATQDMLTVKVPAGAESGLVTIETPGGKASSSIAFEVIPGPIFTAMAPTKGAVGTIVEITGIHFLTQGLQDEVRFNGEKAQVLEASMERLKVQVPRGTTTGKVQITGFGGVAHSTSDFEIEELSPTEAIQVFPNPTTGHFIVSLQHADFDVQAVEVYDAVGKLVHTTKVASPRPEKLEMNIRLSRSGIYTLHFKTDRGTIIKKLTVL